MADKIRIRRGNKAQLPTLDDGEFGLCEDTKELFIGSTSGNLKIPRSTQEAWIAPTLLNGWVNQSDTLTPTGYMKDEFGSVRLRGKIQSGTATSGTVLFILPTGYRPAMYHTAPVSSNMTYGQVQIKTTGEVIIDAGSSLWLSFDNIIFRAEQ